MLHLTLLQIFYYKTKSYVTECVKPQRMGLPMKTALAPRASAFKMSLPHRTPPSTYTSQPLPFKAVTIAGNASICENKRNQKNTEGNILYYACFIKNIYENIIDTTINTNNLQY